jgi:hypothetical protein
LSRPRGLYICPDKINSPAGIRIFNRTLEDAKT